MGEAAQYRQIIDFVNSTGCWAYRNSTGGKAKYRFGKKGQADISGVIFRTGQRLEIEVKCPGGTLSSAQEDFLYNIRCRGGVVLIVESLADVVKEFKRLGLCRD